MERDKKNIIFIVISFMVFSLYPKCLNHQDKPEPEADPDPVSSFLSEYVDTSRILPRETLLWQFTDTLNYGKTPKEIVNKLGKATDAKTEVIDGEIKIVGLFYVFSKEPDPTIDDSVYIPMYDCSVSTSDRSFWHRVIIYEFYFENGKMNYMTYHKLK